MILVGTISIYVLFKNQLGFYVSDDPNMRNRVGQKKNHIFSSSHYYDRCHQEFSKKFVYTLHHMPHYVYKKFHCKIKISIKKKCQKNRPHYPTDPLNGNMPHLGQPFWTDTIDNAVKCISWAVHQCPVSNPCLAHLSHLQSYPTFVLCRNINA